jgi:hypothetical protein
MLNGASPRSRMIRGEKTMKNFVDALGISKERENQIVEMAIQTFQTGYGMAKELDEKDTPGTEENDERFFDNLSSLISEDIKLLSGAGEGMLYGYAMSEITSGFRKSVCETTELVNILKKMANQCECEECECDRLED